MKNRARTSFNQLLKRQIWQEVSFLLFSFFIKVYLLSVEINLGLFGLPFSLCSPCYIKQCAPPWLLRIVRYWLNNPTTVFASIQFAHVLTLKLASKTKHFSHQIFKVQFCVFQSFPKLNCVFIVLGEILDLYFLQKSHFQTKWTWLYCTKSLWRGALLDIRWLLIFCRCHMTLCVCVCVAYDMIHIYDKMKMNIAVMGCISSSMKPTLYSQWSYISEICCA